MAVIIHTPEEIEKMRELGRLVAEALDYIGDFVKPGITTNELDKLVYDYHVNVQGGYPAPLHYGNPPYPKSCCTSINHVICHGIPDDKPLKEVALYWIKIFCQAFLAKLLKFSPCHFKVITHGPNG